LDLPALLSDIAAVVAPVFLIAALGYGWARAGLPFDGAFVTTLMINAATPCLVFATLSGVQVEAGRLATVALAAACCMALAAAGAVLLGKTNME
jgi:predicted permease